VRVVGRAGGQVAGGPGGACGPRPAAARKAAATNARTAAAASRTRAGLGKWQMLTGGSPGPRNSTHRGTPLSEHLTATSSAARSSGVALYLTLV
jgi:hypothetical protein